MTAAGRLERRPWRWRRWIGVLLVAAVASIWPLRHAGTALVVSREIDQPDAIVSLASHEWERLPDTAALGRRAPHAKVVLSQPISLNPYNCHDCGHRVERLVADGIDAARIELMDRKVYRTLDEAEAFKEWAAPRHVRSVVVVTSPYHTARALGCFEHVLKGTGIVVGVHPASASPAEPEAWWRHPYDRWYVTYEWRARLFYLVRFGVR